MQAVDGLPKSKLEHDIRLWEADTAKEYGIPYGDEWYKLPITVREHMVAAILGRKWINNLLEKEAMKS